MILGNNGLTENSKALEILTTRAMQGEMIKLVQEGVNIDKALRTATESVIPLVQQLVEEKDIFSRIESSMSFSTALSKLLEAYGYEISQMDVDCMANFIYEASENYKHCRKSLEGVGL